MTDLARLTATELIAGYRDRSVSPVEATRAALAAIEAADDEVNAFVMVDPEGALAAAKQSESRWRGGRIRGPGDGVPTSIKDIFYTRDWPTLRGTDLIDEKGPWPEDAPAARPRSRSAWGRGRSAPTGVDRYAFRPPSPARSRSNRRTDSSRCGLPAHSALSRMPAP
jgi:hypothetical protein